MVKKGLFYIKSEGFRPGFPSMDTFQAGAVALAEFCWQNKIDISIFPSTNHIFCLKSKDEHHQILHNLMVPEENRSTTCNWVFHDAEQ